MSATKKKEKEEKKVTNVTQILIALIGVIGSIVVAYITVNAKAPGIAENATKVEFKSQLENDKNSIGKLTDKIDKLEKKTSDMESNLEKYPVGKLTDEIKRLETKASILDRNLEKYPIGSIIASILNPNQFARAVGDLIDYNNLLRKWTIADGNPVSGTKFANLTGNKPVPNLRGMFLRGINLHRPDGKGDPDGEREPGTDQSDAFKKHTHEIAVAHEPAISKHVSFPGAATPYSNLGTAAAGGDETRPKNVAVYYYIRIN